MQNSQEKMTMAKPKPIPEGFHSVTPHIVVKDGAHAIDFYKKAFGAEEIMCMPGPGGKGIMHAEIKIGDSVIMLGEECPGMEYVKPPSALKGTTSTLTIYTPDADKAFQKAVAAGAKVTMPLENMFWGDRYGTVRDPSGHEWAIVTHIEDVTPEECAQRAEKLFSQGGPCGEK